jgi:uncharacterized protein YdaU (DUF1376 family)
MAMQKPEWFKIDAAKFLSDAKVDAMTTLELGACLRLLCRQWLDGFVPDDQRLLGRLCRLNEQSMSEVWVTLADFFPVVAPGKRANRFMWIERDKVIAELERRSDEGTRAARKRWDEARKNHGAVPTATPNGLPMPNPMQDQTRADQSRVDKTPSSELTSSSDQGRVTPQKETQYQPSKEASRLATLLKSEILRNNANHKITQAQEREWVITADRMLRLDNRTFEQVAAVIQWAQHDEFWMANILSMDKLRKQFDQLSLKMRANGRSAAPVKLPADYVSVSEEIRTQRLAQRAVAQ